MGNVLIECKSLKKYFNTPRGMLHAVDDVNLTIEEGKTLGVVGESGCGKSTLGRTILNLLPATSGEVLLEGENIVHYNSRQMLPLRQKMQLIFQDPYSSLNPRKTVSQIIAEPIRVHKLYKTKEEVNEATKQLMDTVGLASRYWNTYPHELDGGRRQRIGIARALAMKPKFIVCDEPVSALDVSIQAQILNLMMDLQESMNLTYMFITHDLSVVKHISNDIAVMYLGQVIEKAPTDKLFDNPIHPYTKALLKAIPIPELGHKNEEKDILLGEVSSPINPSKGCRFAPRCPFVCEECANREQTLQETGNQHFVACSKAFENNL